MPLVRWTLEDPELGETFDFPVNPREAGEPERAKNMNGTTSTQGAHVRFQGRDQMPKSQFSGVILSEQHDKFLNDWYDTPHVVIITNHLGQQFRAVLVRLQIVRRNRINNPWSATFTAEYEHYGWIVQHPSYD